MSFKLLRSLDLKAGSPVPGDDKETQDCRVKLLQIKLSSRVADRECVFSVEDKKMAAALAFEPAQVQFEVCLSDEEKERTF